MNFSVLRFSLDGGCRSRFVVTIGLSEHKPFYVGIVFGQPVVQYCNMGRDRGGDAGSLNQVLLGYLDKMTDIDQIVKGNGGRS